VGDREKICLIQESQMLMMKLFQSRILGNTSLLSPDSTRKFLPDFEVAFFTVSTQT